METGTGVEMTEIKSYVYDLIYNVLIGKRLLLTLSCELPLFIFLTFNIQLYIYVYKNLKNKKQL